jgi:hypothetical protein
MCAEMLHKVCRPDPSNIFKPWKPVLRSRKGNDSAIEIGRTTEQFLQQAYISTIWA